MVVWVCRTQRFVLELYQLTNEHYMSLNMRLSDIIESVGQGLPLGWPSPQANQEPSKSEYARFVAERSKSGRQDSTKVLAAVLEKLQGSEALAR